MTMAVCKIHLSLYRNDIQHTGSIRVLRPSINMCVCVCVCACVGMCVCVYFQQTSVNWLANFHKGQYTTRKHWRLLLLSYSTNLFCFLFPSVTVAASVHVTQRLAHCNPHASRRVRCSVVQKCVLNLRPSAPRSRHRDITGYCAI
jgi:hypothetical protein